MKTLLTIIAMLLITLAPAQELSTTALDQFGVYLYQDYQDNFSEYLDQARYDVPMPQLYQPTYPPPMPHLYQPAYNYDYPPIIIPAYWNPYFVPAVYDYGDFRYLDRPYLPQNRSYNRYPYLIPSYYDRPLQRSASYYMIMDILNGK